ncbi:MAG: hypothetical protein HC868_06715 [Sphingomonadales bacterium]|nr:hypothetical protein [Sphingomonadales bacterium]
MRVTSLAVGLPGLLLAASLGPVAAQEFCVACTGPAAVYRCVIGDARQAQGQPLQQFCTTTLTKNGGHAECGIRKGTVFDCDGPIKRIGTASSGPEKSNQPSKASVEPEKPKQRENVADSVRDLSRGTGKQMEKTGEAAKGAATGVWNCVTSLFKSC